MTVAAQFAGHEGRFMDFLVLGRLLEDVFIEEWMWNLAYGLANAGMFDEAVASIPRFRATG